MNEEPSIGQIWKRSGFSDYIVIIDIGFDNIAQEQEITHQYVGYPNGKLTYLSSTFFYYYSFFAKDFVTYKSLLNIQYIVE